MRQQPWLQWRKHRMGKLPYQASPSRTKVSIFKEERSYKRIYRENIS